MGKGETIIIIYVALFIVSIFYNELVAWMEREGFLSGYMAVLVVGGVTYVLVALSLVIPPETLIIIAGAFIFSLAPMVWGDVSRYLNARIDWIKFWNQMRNRGKDDEDEDEDK